MTHLLNATALATDWHHDGGPGWWIVFPLFWIALIATAFLLFRRTRRWTQQPHEAPRESALEVLERRFAEGALSAEEYRERRAVLSEERSTG
jgi:putative membrane protein